MKTELQRLAAELGERVLETPNNPISLAFTLNNLCQSDEPSTQGSGADLVSIAASREPAPCNDKASKDVTFLGSMLWSRYGFCRRIRTSKLLHCQTCLPMYCGYCDVFIVWDYGESGWHSI